MPGREVNAAVYHCHASRGVAYVRRDQLLVALWSPRLMCKSPSGLCFNRTLDLDALGELRIQFQNVSRRRPYAAPVLHFKTGMHSLTLWYLPVIAAGREGGVSLGGLSLPITATCPGRVPRPSSIHPSCWTPPCQLRAGQEVLE